MSSSSLHNNHYYRTYNFRKNNLSCNDISASDSNGDDNITETNCIAQRHNISTDYHPTSINLNEDNIIIKEKKDSSSVDKFQNDDDNSHEENDNNSDSSYSLFLDDNKDDTNEVPRNVISESLASSLSTKRENPCVGDDRGNNARKENDNISNEIKNIKLSSIPLSWPKQIMQIHAQTSPCQNSSQDLKMKTLEIQNNHLLTKNKTLLNQFQQLHHKLESSTINNTTKPTYHKQISTQTY